MSQLPKNWQSTTSGDVCEYITSGSRDWKSFYSDHGPLFVRTQDINQDRLDLTDVAHVDLPAKVEGKRSRIQPGDLLVTITGANVGKVALVPDEIPEAYVSQSVGLMRLKDKRNGPYLHYYLQSDQTGRKQVLNLVYGIGRPVLSLQNLRDIPVALPPLPEQRRIVAEIEKQFTRLEAGVAALRRVQANLKRYRAAVLKAACEGKLVPTEAELTAKNAKSTKTKPASLSASSAISAVKNSGFETGAELLARILAERRQNWQGRGQYKEPAAPDTANLPPLPEGWTWASVAQVSAIIVDCPHSTAKFVSVGLPCVDTTCIKPGRIVREKLRFVSPETFSKRVERLVPATDDIIFAREGTVGTAVAIPADVKPCLGQRVMLMRADACISPSYFQQCLNSQTIRQQYLPKIVGSTAPHINVAEVKLLALPLPPAGRADADRGRSGAAVERGGGVGVGGVGQPPARHPPPPVHPPKSLHRRLDVITFVATLQA